RRFFLSSDELVDLAPFLVGSSFASLFFLGLLNWNKSNFSPVKLGPESLVDFVLICSESTTSSYAIIFSILMVACGVLTALGACGFFTSSDFLSFTGSVDFSVGSSTFLGSILAVFSSVCFSCG